MSTLFEANGARMCIEPIVALPYPEIATSTSSRQAGGDDANGKSGVEPNANDGPSLDEIEQLVAVARLEGREEAEKRITAEFQAKLKEHAAQIERALAEFALERKKYFSELEIEVVRLTLAIAAKILHREAQVDPSLVAALVRISIERMDENSAVKLRVSPSQTASWRRWMGDGVKEQRVSIIEDASVSKGGCILETSLGSADFSLESQLKEVERGFFDLLALRP